MEEPDTQSILELRGLGKALWTDIDAAAHVDAERRSWDRSATSAVAYSGFIA